MSRDYKSIPTAESWQLSNPPIIALTAHKTTLEIFSEFGMKTLAAQGAHLNKILEERLKKMPVTIFTPPNRGTMLSFKLNKVHRPLKDIQQSLHQKGLALDLREPGIFRMTHAPIYITAQDVHEAVQILQEELS
jgi:kynureninase